MQSQLVKQMTQAYKDDLQIIVFPANSGGVREKTFYSITKSYGELMVVEQKEESLIL